MPETGPTQVVPEYGIRIMSPYIVAVPLNETSHAVTPGPVAPAVARTGSVDGFPPLRSPHAEPDAARLPAHRAKKMPEIIVAV